VRANKQGSPIAIQTNGGSGWFCTRKERGGKKGNARVRARKQTRTHKAQLQSKQMAEAAGSARKKKEGKKTERREKKTERREIVRSMCGCVYGEMCAVKKKC